MSDTVFNRLIDVEEGDQIEVKIDDFDNTLSPHKKNPRKIAGEVVNIEEDVSYSAGEIQRVVTIGDPWEDGCNIDVGDTSENKMTGGVRSYTYTKAWRPRRTRDRLLLGKVVDV